MNAHLEIADEKLRAIHRRAQRAMDADNRMYVDMYFQSISELAYEAIDAIARAKEAEKPWWSRLI